MRKIIVILIFTALSFFYIETLAANAGRLSDHPRVLACHQIEWEKSKAATARLIRCASRVWNAPNTPDYAVCIAEHESGLYAKAIGGSNNHYVGLYQFYIYNWNGIANKYIKPLEINNLRWQNGEANIIAAMRIAHMRGTWDGYWTTTRFC